MENYSEFAEVYDMFMDNIPYEEWGEYLYSLLKEYGVDNGIIADLGCGTGNITQYLAAIGYDMIGIDYSDEMLNIAMEKRDENGYDILYLNQDMREFELYGTVSGIVSICDSMNYIIEEEELLEVFKLVNNYLDIGGVFIFDMNTIYKYTQIGDSTIAENREEASFIWENTYYKEDNINEYDLTLFIRDEHGKYDKYTENHLQRGYSLEQIKKLITLSGMEYIGSYSAFTKEPVSDTTERMYIIARECEKAGKCK